MKKLLSILLCLAMALSLAACGSDEEKETKTVPEATEAQETSETQDTSVAQEITEAEQTSEEETPATFEAGGIHPLYLLENRNNLSGLISPVQLVDRSGIEKALPTEQKSDLTLGACLMTLMSSFFVDIQNGFIDQCEAYGYEYSVLVSERDTSKTFGIIDTFISQGVDGMLIHSDPDSLVTAAETSVAAGIPCDSCMVPNDVMNPLVTAVTNGDFNSGYVTGLYVGENLYYPKWKDQADPVLATVMFGNLNMPITTSKICGILTGMVESVSKLQGSPIAFEDAAYLCNDYVTELVMEGAIEIPELNMSITGYGEGQNLTAEALTEAEDLFTSTPDMQLMISDNDYMAIGGILAAQAIGVNIGTDCVFFACSDGTMVALEYIRDGLLYCTGVNCAYALGWGNVEVFHKIYEEGYDASNMPNQTLVDTIALTSENWEEYYDPSIELVRETTIQFLTTEEKLAQYGL